MKQSTFLASFRSIALFFTLLTGFSFLSAQVTYQSSDYVSATDSVLMSRASVGSLILNNFNTAGANVNWDYSNMTATSQEWTYFLDPDNTNYEPSFLTFCIAECLTSGGNPFTCPFDCADDWDDLDLAVPTGDSINLGLLALTNIYDFFDNTGNTLEQNIIGYSVEVAGLPVPLINTFNSADTVYNFPINYGDVDSCYSGYDIDLSNVGINLTFLRRYQRINEVEGWGTLQTPYGTFNNVLKIKTTIHNADTIIWQGDTLSLTTFLPPELAPTTQVEYKWIDPTYGYPVLIASGIELLGLVTINQVDYLDDFECFDPTPFFAYLPIPTYLDSATSQVDVTFFSLSSNANNFSWDFGDGGTSNVANPTHTYTSGGIFPVTLTACNNLCSPPSCESITLPVIVIDTNSVFANFLALPSSACIGTPILFTNLSIQDTAWLWDFGDGNTSTAENPTHTYAAPGDYMVTLTAMNPLSTDVDTQFVSISPQVSGSFTNSSNLTQLPIQFTNTSSGTDSSTNFLWTFLGGNPNITSSTDENPVVTFGSSGTVIVCMTATNALGCGDVVCETIEIDPCMEADFSTGILIAACPNDNINLDNESDGLTPINYTWLIDGNFHDNATNSSISFADGGTYTITLIADNGTCADTAQQSVTVIDIDAGADVSICPGQDVNLSATSVNPVTVFNWSPGSGLSCTLCANPTASPSNTTTYSVTTIDVVCGTLTDDVTVTVLPLPEASFSPTPQSGTTTIDFTDTSQDVDTWLWDFGDGNTSTMQSPSHVYSAPGTYTVCLTTTNGCGTDSACQTVSTICPVPVTDFNYTPDNLTLDFFDQSANSPTSWLWDFGDGNVSTAQNPVHTYANPGTYYICLTATSICGTDSSCQQIFVSCAPPDPEFSYAPVSGLNFEFSDLSTGSPTSWVWNFGDGGTSTIQNPTHVYPVPGSYTVCLSAFNNCGIDSSCQVIDVDYPASLDPNLNQHAVAFYPNPSPGQSYLSFELAQSEYIEIELIDVLGRPIFSEVMQKQPGTHTLPIELPYKGIYWLRLRIDQKEYLQKVIR